MRVTSPKLSLIDAISMTLGVIVGGGFNEPGGSFVYISPLVGTEVAGTLNWFLILGYLFTIALYASTFGAFATLLLDVNWQYAPSLGALVVILLAAINLARYSYF